MTRGDVTTSWHEETTRGRVVFRIQTESTGKVSAMVTAGVEHKPELLGFGDESYIVSYVVQKGLRS